MNAELHESGIRNPDFGTKTSSFIPPYAFCLLALVTVVILVCPALLWPQDDIKGSGPGLTASLDRDSARVGSMVSLTLGYRLPEGASLPADPEIKGLEGITILERAIGSDRIRISLLVDRLGSWKTGPLSLTYLDKEEKAQILTADPVSLRVLSNLGEKPAEAQLKPIQGIIPTKPLWIPYLPWTAGVLGLLLIVLALAWWYKRNRSKKLSIIPEDPPHIRAKKEIEELEAQRLFEEGHVKQFYFRFSEILRRYMESLRGFPAAEFTTEEIALSIHREEDRRLLPLLRQADLVKFAETMPTQARKEEEVKGALSYIRETSPVVEGAAQ